MASVAPGPGQSMTLRGRARECALLDDLVSVVRRGEGRALVIRGEAGIGKTALLEYLVRSTSDLTVLRAVGVESEMELAYASLHQLCATMLDRLGRLPDPQRQALEIVFGLSAGAAPDRLLVGLAVLSLFSEAADERPLLCLVDDAQWLDNASARTLAFVARRLFAERVGLVFGTREVGEELMGLPDVEVRGLRNEDARALLNSAVLFALDEGVRDRIVAEAAGNPLALLELPRGLTPAELAGGFRLPTAQPLPERIEDNFIRRLQTLSDDARRLALLAAAEPLGDPQLLLRAAEQLMGSPSAVFEETEGLLTSGVRVTFRHPLVRSAVYRTATDQERRQAHRALAEATDREVDPDRRAWHLAAASAGPDERIALQLERSAGRAQARGGLAAAAAFLERAVALTEDPTRWPERALAAAQANLQAGAFDTALQLLATAEAAQLDEFQRARAKLIGAQIAFASGASEAALMLLKAGSELEPFDLQLARETYLTAWAATLTTGETDVVPLIWRAVRALPRPDEPSPLDLLLDGLALLATVGRAAATSMLQRATAALADISVEDVLRWGWVATGAPTAVWDDEAFCWIAARQVQLVRDAGTLAELPIYLSQLGIARAWVGDFGGAASVIAEIDSVAAATGSRFPPYALLALRALEGCESDASAAIASAIEQAPLGAQGLTSYADLAAAVLYNGLGRYDKAASAARRAASNTFQPWYSMWALPELVEAAARAGDPELARDALARLVETTQPSGTDWALGIEARCRALLTHGASADEGYRNAIERLRRTKLRPELARAQLVYGEWLRRENRRVDARERLRVAHDQFRSIGMDAFAERARMELLATGERVRERGAGTRDELTPQELQIAGMAREGLSNREIGARLFLSHRTVESHLSKVFGKLGIHSRRELEDALAGLDSERRPGDVGDVAGRLM